MPLRRLDWTCPTPAVLVSNQHVNVGLQQPCTRAMGELSKLQISAGAIDRAARIPQLELSMVQLESSLYIHFIGLAQQWHEQDCDLVVNVVEPSTASTASSCDSGIGRASATIYHQYAHLYSRLSTAV